MKRKALGASVQRGPRGGYYIKKGKKKIYISAKRVNNLKKGALAAGAVLATTYGVKKLGNWLGNSMKPFYDSDAY